MKQRRSTHEAGNRGCAARSHHREQHLARRRLAGALRGSIGTAGHRVRDVEGHASRCETYPNEAPKTVEHILTLVRRSFYNGQRVHRFVAGFVVQFGDPQTRDMTKRDLWGRTAEAAGRSASRKSARSVRTSSARSRSPTRAIRLRPTVRSTSV